MSEKFITCNYQGRLGNLMFEIAATLSAAWNNNLTPSFPKYPHHYYNDITAFQEYISPILSKFHKHWNDVGFRKYSELENLSYKPIITQENTKLYGYFTSSLYFDEHRDRIIDLFSTHKETVDGIYKNIKDRFPNRELVSVHVRRTDYVTDYKWDLPLEYYKKASTLFDDPVYIIFSDDMEWCIENLTPFMKDEIEYRDQDYIELLLMGKFDAHIIANSTFSAMAAILGDRDKTKKVIAPKNWCPTLFNKNIYEPHWIIL